MSLCCKRLLHNKFSNQYLSKYSSVSLSYQCLNPDTTLLTIDINWKPLTINAKLKDMILLAIVVNMDTSNQLINVSNRTQSTRLQSCKLSTPLYHWAQSWLLCQPDSSDLLINVINRTWSTRLQSCELSTPLPLGAISFSMSTGQ